MHSSPHELSEARALLALTTIPGVGDVGIGRRLATHSTAAAALEREPSQQRIAAFEQADAIINLASHCGARVIGRTHPDFPAALLDLQDPPAVIFTRGNLTTAHSPTVAIVGTRNASHYGKRIAADIARACALAGVSVVSGLARGIDSVAHEAALAAGGRTVAVLGTGVDVYYPPANRALQEQIAVDGLLLAELPPGTRGHMGTFPRRNRLIAALAELTVVVEAPDGSGALITADCALDLGRMVGCVPNAIDAPSAVGSNRLLKKHAEPILSPEDVLTLLNLRAQPTPPPLLDDNAAACWSAVQQGASDAFAIARSSGLPMRLVATALTMLELEGLLSIDPLGLVRPSVGHGAR